MLIRAICICERFFFPRWLPALLPVPCILCVSLLPGITRKELRARYSASVLPAKLFRRGRPIVPVMVAGPPVGLSQPWQRLFRRVLLVRFCRQRMGDLFGLLCIRAAVGGPMT